MGRILRHGRRFASRVGRREQTMLSVVHGNTTALKLYNKLGSQVTDEDEVEGKEGRTYHTTQLKMQL